MKHFLEVNDDNWIKEAAIIPKGKWYFPCCQEDLQQSEGDEAMRSMDYYDYKWEAKIDIIRMWLRSWKNIGVKSVLKNIIWTIKK